jgi:hypothetical protein
MPETRANTQTKNADSDESPFQPGECKCGVPNCAGHELEEDGKVHIRNHPDGHLVFDMSKHINENKE